MLFLVSGLGVYAAQVPDSLQFHVIFTVDSTTVRPDLYGNDEVLAAFKVKLDSLNNDERISGVFLTVRGNASQEGPATKNRILAAKRARALFNYLVLNYYVDSTHITVLPEQPLYVEAEAILSAFPQEYPGIDLPAIRKISRTAKGTEIRQAFRQLDGCSDGANWTWYKKNVLSPTRFAEVRLSYSRPAEPRDSIGIVPAPVPVPEAVEVEAEPQPEQAEPQPTQPEPPVKVERKPDDYRIGTNLLYDAATVANLYFEVGFARHLAFNISATFSPWDIRRPDFKIRTLLFQPELRWYFAKDFKGHYVGVEGHYGWYNVALGGKTRYQDKDGNTPLWGAGLSYGYVYAFNEHWGMDFAISAGYANLVYDCFYNIENGAKYTTRSKDWWGPTRVGISIYYQF